MACHHEVADMVASRHLVCRSCKTSWALKLYWMRAYAEAVTHLMTKEQQDLWLAEHVRVVPTHPQDGFVQAFKISVLK